MGNVEEAVFHSVSDMEFEAGRYREVRASVPSWYTVDEIPSTVYAACTAPAAERGMDWQRVPLPLRDMLTGYQRTGCEFGVKAGGRFLIADEMGVGKTFQGIAFACNYPGPYLVITKADIRLQWKSEIERTTGKTAHAILDKRDALRVEFNDPDAFYVVGYEAGAMTKGVLRDKLKSTDWGVVLADESDKLRGADTGISKFYALDKDAVMRKAARVCLMTGTPQHSLPRELYPQLCILFPDLKMSYKAFTERYCEGFFNRTYNRWMAEGVTRPCELNALLCKRMIRRFKRDTEVIRELPKLIIQKVELVLSDTQQAEYNVCYEAYRKQVADHERACQASNTVASAHSKHEALRQRKKLENLKMKLHHDLSRIKAPIVREFVEQSIKLQKAKSLLFTHYEVMREELNKMTCKHLSIEGSTTAKRRHVVREELNNPESEVEVGILSMAAAGVGGNYGAGCNAAYFCDLPWSESLWRQCIGRVHRKGQCHEVRIYNLVVRNTLDEELIRMHERKAERVNVVIDNGRADPIVYDTAESLRAMTFGINLADARLLQVGPVADESQEHFVMRVAVVLPRLFVDYIPQDTNDADGPRAAFCNADASDSDDVDWFIVTDLSSEALRKVRAEQNVERRAQLLDDHGATILHVFKRA